MAETGAMIVGLVAGLRGLEASGGPRGVADGVNSSVVLSITLIFLSFLGLTQLQNNEGLSNWGPVMAGTVIATVPMIIVFILLQRHMIKGLTAGAVKG